jgi:hypothetical protein
MEICYIIVQVEPIIIEDGLLTTKKKFTPYVIRPLETELFEIYFQLNKNINPIFCSNCT